MLVQERQKYMQRRTHSVAHLVCNYKRFYLFIYLFIYLFMCIFISLSLHPISLNFLFFLESLLIFFLILVSFLKLYALQSIFHRSLSSTWAMISPLISGHSVSWPFCWTVRTCTYINKSFNFWRIFWRNFFIINAAALLCRWRYIIE